MKRILHRCNTFDDLERGFTEFDGAECDVRLANYNSYGATISPVVVLQHGRDDPPMGYTLSRGLRWLEDRCLEPRQETLAINVKDTGMAPVLAEVLRPHAHWLNYFLFDVPGVELPEYEKHGLRVFGRVSDFERVAPTLDGGLLVDAFDTGKQREFVDYAVNHPRGYGVALISNRCHGFDAPNYTEGVDYLIGKAEDFA